MDRVYRILTESLLSEDLFYASRSPSPLAPSPTYSASAPSPSHLPWNLSFALRKRIIFRSLYLSFSLLLHPLLSLSLSLPPVPSCLSLGPSPTSGGPTRRPFGQPIPSKVCYTTRRTFENGLPPPSKLFLAPSLARLSSSLARRSLRRRNRGGCDARLRRTPPRDGAPAK